MSSLSTVTEAMRRFADERDWARFHDPKSLVLALVGEVGEVAELVQWLPAAEARALLARPEHHEAVAAELADVLMYIARLADVLGVDMADAARKKLALNEVRFPVATVRSVAPERASGS